MIKFCNSCWSMSEFKVFSKKKGTHSGYCKSCEEKYTLKERRSNEKRNYLNVLKDTIKERINEFSEVEVQE